MKSFAATSTKAEATYQRREIEELLRLSWQRTARWTSSIYNPATQLLTA